jgi:alanyl-tRNA synthetase
VRDTQRDGDLILHQGHLTRGALRSGTRVPARVDAARRQAIRRAHSATHVLHHALRRNLGEHAQQQGSKVDRDLLRFDFTNMTPVPADQPTRSNTMSSMLATAEADPVADRRCPRPGGWP